MLNQTEMTTLLTPSVVAMMARAVFRAVGETGANDDIVNDAIVRILSSADQFDASRGAFQSWACQIAANLGRNWRKASANHGHDSEGHADEDGTAAPLVDTLIGTDGHADIARRSEARMLAAAIATLDEDAQTFLAAMADGMGQCEAGAIVADLAEEMG
jgi:DNA-directed RNA polymerase specialized sigma24 family protein